jgi:hypothetical protein
MTNNTETQTTTRRVAIGSLNQGDTFILRVGAHEYPATVALTTPDAIMYTSPELTAVVPGFGTVTPLHTLNRHDVAGRGYVWKTEDEGEGELTARAFIAN